MQMDPTTLFQVVGALVVGRFVLHLLQGIYASMLRGGKDLKKYGEWAIVTGATDGIGKAMAFEIARKGLKVLLISRSADKLAAVKEELSGSCAEVETMAIDATDFNDEAQDKVRKFVASHDVGVLINNVGMSYPFPQYFSELSEWNVNALTEINVKATTVMTHIVLPKMEEAKRGAIVNISSASGCFSSPLLAQYSATKSYVELFTAGLHAEVAHKGVHVQVQAPMFVSTKLASIRKPRWDAPSPDSYAKVAVAAIGYETSTTPYWSHKLIVSVVTSLPTFVADKVIFGMHAGLRKRGLKKAAAKAAEAKAE